MIGNENLNCVHNFTAKGWNSCKQGAPQQTNFCDCHSREKRLSGYYRFYMYWYIPMMTQEFHTKALTCSVTTFDKKEQSEITIDKGRAIIGLVPLSMSDIRPLRSACEGEPADMDTGLHYYINGPQGTLNAIKLIWSKQPSPEYVPCTNNAYDPSETYSNVATYDVTTQTLSAEPLFSGRIHKEVGTKGFPYLKFDAAHRGTDQGCFEQEVLIDLNKYKTSTLQPPRSELVNLYPPMFPRIRWKFPFQVARAISQTHFTLEIVGSFLISRNLLITCRLKGLDGIGAGMLGDPPVNITILTNGKCIRQESGTGQETAVENHHCSRQGTLAQMIRKDLLFGSITCKVTGASLDCHDTKLDISAVHLTDEKNKPLIDLRVDFIEGFKLAMQGVLFCVSVFIMARSSAMHVFTFVNKHAHVLRNARRVQLQMIGYTEKEIDVILKAKTKNYETASKRYSRLENELVKSIYDASNSLPDGVKCSVIDEGSVDNLSNVSQTHHKQPKTKKWSVFG